VIGVFYYSRLRLTLTGRATLRLPNLGVWRQSIRLDVIRIVSVSIQVSDDSVDVMATAFVS
jgi:hypothetical protein